MPDSLHPLLIVGLISLFIGKAGSVFVPPALCNSACGKSMNETKTAVFCNKSTELKLFGRCCINSTLSLPEHEAVVLGIDLQNCSITEGIFGIGIKNMSKLEYISLQGNDIKEISVQDFHRNTGIKYLSLPPNLPCPGSPDIWNQTKNTSTATICWEELDPCQVHNVSCPENSHCEPSGVDLTECLCDEGYYGYKCLNRGTFPVLPFALGVAVPTVILCGLLWVTQRRYVIDKNK